ncbi:hypothetical protein LR032_00125, partial [Candidatus Bipolaricaulota bacterium]|nr:hypothetical protein [Candidatus Bipolaricaulota bacterium]
NLSTSQPLNFINTLPADRCAHLNASTLCSLYFTLFRPAGAIESADIFRLLTVSPAYAVRQIGVVIGDGQ